MPTAQPRKRTPQRCGREDACSQIRERISRHHWNQPSCALDEQFDDLLAPVVHGDHQRRLAKTVGRVDVGACFQQERHQVGPLVWPLRQLHQRREPRRVLRVYPAHGAGWSIIARQHLASMAPHTLNGPTDLYSLAHYWDKVLSHDIGAFDASTEDV